MRRTHNYDACLALTRVQPFDLSELLFYMAREVADPDLDIDVELARLDVLAGQFQPDRDWNRARLERFSEFFADRLMFHGDPGRYYEIDNSLLNRVLSRRIGIPITLSAVYQALVNRHGLGLLGVCSPGHFLLRCDVLPGAPLFVDAFHGGKVRNEEETLEFLRAFTGQEELDADVLLPATVDEIVQRALANLKSLYIKREEWTQVQVVKRLQCGLETAIGEDWLERAAIESMLGMHRLSADSATRALSLGLRRKLDRELETVLSRIKEHYVSLQ